MDQVQKQREYYAKTARIYDELQASNLLDEHYVATAALAGLMDLYNIQSLLDVGCGTGRSLEYLSRQTRGKQLYGVEPVDALRERCIAKGLSESNVRPGNAYHLEFADQSMDCVSMFGVLHHLESPQKAIDEAFRVASKMVFISDHNLYGMGSSLTKWMKYTLRSLRLEKALHWAITGGRGYHDTDWDGVFYPFSILNYYAGMKSRSSHLYCISTKTPGVNLWRDASHVAVVAIKHPGSNVSTRSTPCP